MSEVGSDDKPRRSKYDDEEKTSKRGSSEVVKPQSQKVIKGDEARRNLKWVSYTRAKISFGFQHLAAAYVPAMLEEPRGLCICLDKVSGWSIPTAVMKEFGKGDYEITAQLSFSLFHLSSSTFFGTTWMGPSVSLGHGNDQVIKTIDFEYTDIIYMLSRITDPTCVGIIEIVVSKFDLKKNLVAQQFGCGWTMINLFIKPPPPDIAEGHENVPLTSCSLFAGTPRDLIINTDLKTLASRLKEIPDCNLYFKLYSHRRLLKAHRLVAENEALGRFDTVAGLLPRAVAPPGSTTPRLLPCIGDEEVINDRDGVLSLPATPRLATACLLKIANSQLYMPNRRAVEIKMCAEYASMLQVKDVSKVLVVSRKLRIGLHNGNTVLGGEWQSHNLVEDKHDPDVLFTPTKSDITVEGYVPDAYMALAFMVEYELGIPVPRNTHFNSQAMMRSTTWQDGRMVTAFTVCAAIYIPCNGNRLVLRNTGPRRPEEDGVDIELQLLKDEAAMILSAKPFLLLNEGESEGLDATTKGRLNLRAGEKDSAGDKTAQLLEEEDSGTSMLGFDLRVIHPTLGEVRHGDGVTDLLQSDLKKATKKLTAADEDRSLEETRKARHERVESKHGDSDDEKTNIDATGASRTFRTGELSASRRGFAVTMSERGKSPTATDLRSSRASTFRDRRRDEDEEESVADSIVTGDSGHSSLRLDALYYTSMGKTRDPRSYMGKEAWDSFSERSSDAGIVRGTIRDAKFAVPRNKDSLLAQSLQAKLVTKDRTGQNLSVPEELLPTNKLPYRHDDMRIAPKTSVVGIQSNAAHIRELSRGARSRLSRHGFDGALQDTPLDSALGEGANVGPSGKARAGLVSGKNVVVDLELEARDELSLHEVNIQFAGYRAGPALKKGSVGPAMDHYTPKAVYFSFQFYSCMPTRTEIMRLLPAHPGELCVLARDDAQSRDEPPLTLRFFVDCSTASPNEAHEFAEYLAHCSLYVDVWDANSLLHLGTCGIPLRRLMRQGQRMVKHAAECDVINSELAAVTSQGGISSTVIAEGGPASGVVVGAVQLILSNSGHEGRNPKPRGKGSMDDFHPVEGLNWRAFGVAQDVRNAATAAGANRPKNSVRAKPLSESSPELYKALAEVRHSAEHRPGGASLRSLTDPRGVAGGSTLTYDEVSVLFKRFRGPQKGTVQYAGDLLALLDMPSLAVALKKLVLAYRKFGDYDGLLKEVLRHSNAASELSASDTSEALKTIFDRTGIPHRPEEITLLTEKILSSSGGGAGNGHVSAQQMVEFFATEADRHEWTIVGNRLRLCAQRATLEGKDVEQMLADLDVDGSHYVTATQFKKFLQALGPNLAPKDVNLCCRHFSRRPPHGQEDRGTVSLKEVMAFLGGEYVGNLQVRIRRLLKESEKGSPDAREMVLILNSAGGSARPADAPLVYTYDDIEAAFSMLGIYKEVTHDQARTIIKKLDVKGTGKLSATQVLTYLGIPHKASDLTPSAAAAAKAEVVAEAYKDIDAEGLLRLLLDKVQGNGVAVDEAFRHFDINGDGSITRSELVQGLTKLRIFDNVPNWKAQLPALMKKFDIDGSGEVSLREFFKFLGIIDYAPNIIQRMTKIFAVATQKGVSIKDIFTHLDSDGSGQLDAQEIEAGLKELGSFGEVTPSDAAAVVAHFDKDGDKHVSIEEFVNYFSERVRQAIAERKKKRSERALMMLRKTFAGAMSKGAKLREIFAHLDKDKSGAIDVAELMQTIKQLPSFKKMTEADMADLLEVLDSDGSGGISFDEFESFLQGEDDLEGSSASVGTLGASGGAGSPPATLIDRIRDTFKLAEGHGLSFEKAFNLLDRDGSGGITISELHAALQKLPNFTNVSLSEVRELHETIDVDRSGDITVEEFRRFVKEGKLYSPQARQEQRSKLDADSGRGKAGHKDGELTPELVQELFVRHMKRISVHDGGVSGLLAYLDSDEDGLIALTTLKALLRREDVFDAIPEHQVVALLEPLMADDQKNVRAAALLRFVEGGKLQARGTAEGKDATEADHVVLPKEYEFSSDPEIRALEKKVRGFGRILAKKGVDVESMFRSYDPKLTGSVRRTELLEVLSKLGMYILEQGRVLEQAAASANDVQRIQMHQINRLKGKGGEYLQNAPRMARRLLMSGNIAPEGDFKDHLESMTLVNWYRQSQKQQLLQRVLSHSLAHTIHIYPRFGKTQFFEFPLTNPFAHEERFQIDITDPELRLVTAFDEWLHLRRACRPAVGELGQEPVEADMFDRDGEGHIQVVLLPHETLYLPFTFMTLLPFAPVERRQDRRRAPPSGGAPGILTRFGGRAGGESKHDDEAKDSESKAPDDEPETPQRTVEVKVISGTHGHLVSILKVQVCPRPFVLNRTLRFQEIENSIMKRRIQIVGHENMAMYPGEYPVPNKYVHCVEGGVPMPGAAGVHGAGTGIVQVAGEDGTGNRETQSRVVVEWGPSSEQFSGVGALDLLIRYRCGPFPTTGTFYLLIYNDPYQSQLDEVWQVVVQTRQRLDVHGTVGCASSADLVVRGDRYARRARAYALPSPADVVHFRPDAVFQLVPGAYNRVALAVTPKAVGYRHVQVNLVDEDSRELVSAWLMTVAATSPAVMRSYDVDVPAGRPLHKKIVFKNPWDVPRVFKLSSSDEALMRPRSSTVEVAALGTAYLRLWFSGLESGGAGVREVHLFLNDATAGQNEECYLFRIRDV